ncbi:MAG: glycosyltransferase [Gemmatimonadetes bacterium]|nr:glycosyltransferase [Gemmatimonadota bacterium]
MRILHLAKYYWPRSGGMERVVQDLAEGAAAQGHEVAVLAVESRVGGRVGGRQRSTITRVFSFGALGSQEIAPGYLAAARRRADIIHLHHPHPLADVASLLRSRRTPLVVTQHQDGKKPGTHFMARAVLRRAAAIVVPSRAHMALSEELEGFENKTEVIPFGIDEERWADVPRRPIDARRGRCSSAGWSSSRAWTCCCGRWSGCPTSGSTSWAWARTGRGSRP